jgi:DNA-binding NarL/FixJ family response regulator
VRAFVRRVGDVIPDVLVAVQLSASSIAELPAPVVCISDNARTLPRNVRAILPSSASLAEITAAIEAAANDLTTLTQDQVTRWLQVAHQELDSEIVVEELTPRELQVLRMIADGYGNKEIAVELAISEHTVKFHVAQILGKLNAASRTEAVSIGIRRGLIAV